MADGQQSAYSWVGKRVLITGHTGFIGSWLSLWLHHLGAKLTGYALAPHTQPSLYQLLNLDEHVESVIADICDHERLKQTIGEFQPQVIVHLAAQAIVGQANTHPYEAWRSNALGTVALMEAVKDCGDELEALVLYTTDKVYDNQEDGRDFTEEDTVGGFGLYDASKGAAELAIRAFRHAGLAPAAMGVIRAGNVIGGGDWNDSRLVPDAVQSFVQNQPVVLRHPHGVRPWQHVLELVHATMRYTEHLAQWPDKYAGNWNIAPQFENELSVAQLVEGLAESFTVSPAWQQQAGEALYPEANILRLDASKFRRELGWQEVLSAKEMLEWTAQWYQQFYQSPQNIAEFTLQQMKSFQAKT